jgi:Pyridoxamine 5'-phosphate oxidase
MRHFKLLPLLFTLTTAAPLQKIPTLHTSAILARRLLTLTPSGTLSTIFPTSSPHGSLPIGLPDYLAACDPLDASNPTLLALSIATSFRNGLVRGANISLSVAWEGGMGRWSAEEPRVALVGYLDVVGEGEVAEVERCFLERHPDARRWVPGNRVHRSFWVRLVVREVFWVGGFGDRAFIGWIPVEEWRGVTREEIEGVRLPGEEDGEGVDVDVVEEL